MSTILREKNKPVLPTSNNRLSRETVSSDVRYDLEVQCKVKDSIFPYRNSTVPQTLSSRLKKSETLPADGWQNPRTLYRMSSCGNSRLPETKLNPEKMDFYDVKLKSSLIRSGEAQVQRKIETQKMKTSSSAPLHVKKDSSLKIERLNDEFINQLLPPPLPPKRTSSRRVEKVSKGNEALTSDDKITSSSNMIVDKAAKSKIVTESSLEDSDLLVALQKISLRLNEMQVEKSPVLGHYSALYRMDQYSWRNQAINRGNSSPNWSTCMPGLHNFPIRPRRSAYTNLI